MSTLNVASDTSSIRRCVPSKRATHYHRERQCYLSLDHDGQLYIWCHPNVQWLRCQTPLHREAMRLTYEDES